MTTEEHLKKIKAKCESLMLLHIPTGNYQSAIAGWRATIAAIDSLQLIHEQTDLGEYPAWDALKEIIAAWPEELL